MPSCCRLGTRHVGPLPVRAAHAMQAVSRRTLQPIDHIDDASEILGGTTGWQMAGRPAAAVAIIASPAANRLAAGFEKKRARAAVK